jgi:tetratricopeptide (TPR) repeat protein
MQPWENRHMAQFWYILFAFQHKEFSKGKKRVTIELCDKEKQSDALLSIGESYQKLRNFIKARKWYEKSLKIYQSIGNLEASLHSLIYICVYVGVSAT